MIMCVPGAQCLECKKALPKGATFWGPDGWRSHDWTCGHSTTLSCPECCKKEDRHKTCPECGCSSEYT